jgi:hypothetical protein
MGQSPLRVVISCKGVPPGFTSYSRNISFALSGAICLELVIYFKRIKSMKIPLAMELLNYLAYVSSRI